jgi:hypothetical protein
MDAEELEPFIGEWTLAASFPDDRPGGEAGRTTFEWMPGRCFLLQCWEVPHPQAPDGLSVIGWDEGRRTYLQHYFDSRGVARVYAMTFADGLWTLERTTPDFAPLDFAQRFEGRFSDDGMRIDGRWEIAQEPDRWELDFDLTYRRA